MCIPPDKAAKKSVGSNTVTCENKVNGKLESSGSLDSNENVQQNGGEIDVNNEKSLIKKTEDITSDCSNMEISDQNGLDNESSNINSKSESDSTDSSKQTLDAVNQSKDLELDSEKAEKQKEEDSKVSDDNVDDSDLVRDPKYEKEVLSAEELQDLHAKADILHFLLPALCHLTAEEDPRHILLQCGGLGVLDLYMWRQWERFIDQVNLRETLVCLL